METRLGTAVPEGFKTGEVSAELFAFSTRKFLLELLNVLAHGVEDVARTGVLGLDVPAFGNAAVEVLVGEFRVTLEWKLFVSVGSRDGGTGRSLAAVTHLEADVVEDGGELFGKKTVKGRGERLGGGGSFVGTECPVVGTVAAVAHLAAETLYDREAIFERFKGLKTVRQGFVCERGIDEFVPTMGEPSGLRNLAWRPLLLTTKTNRLGSRPLAAASRWERKGVSRVAPAPLRRLRREKDWAVVIGLLSIQKGVGGEERD